MVKAATRQASRPNRACTQMLRAISGRVLSAQGHADWRIPQGAVFIINQLVAQLHESYIAFLRKRSRLIERFRGKAFEER